jgi:dehydrogenase/reductase SDR family protein 7B
MFEGKCWWVTGASSGIGAAVARALSREGARLVLSGRNVSALNDVAAACATETLVLPFEATDYAALPPIVDKACAWAGQRGGQIDGLVNNAGISQRSVAAETVFDVYQKIIAVDLLAPIALTQALLPYMVAKGGGDIVAISSVAGLVGAPLRTAYSAAKHGLIGYHDSLRAETAQQGVRVLVVAPGSVRTNVSRNALDATGEARGVSDAAIDNGLAPDVLADQILEGVRSGKRELVLAEGMEAEIVKLRRQNPDALFDLMAQMFAAGYAQRMGAEKSKGS